MRKIYLLMSAVVMLAFACRQNVAAQTSETDEWLQYAADIRSLSETETYFLYNVDNHRFINLGGGMAFKGN